MVLLLPLVLPKWLTPQILEVPLLLENVGYNTNLLLSPWTYGLDMHEPLEPSLGVPLSSVKAHNSKNVLKPLALTSFI